MAGPTIGSIFARIDTRADGAISRDEVKSMVEKAKVGGGIFGGVKVNQATDAFMDALDTNKDGKVVMDEVGAQLKALVAKLGDGQPGKTIPEIAGEWFVKSDTSKDGKLSQSEVKAPIKQALEDDGQSMADLKADIAAKIGVYLLDEDKSGQISREEADSLAADIQEKTQPPAPVPAPEEPAVEWC